MQPATPAHVGEVRSVLLDRCDRYLRDHSAAPISANALDAYHAAAARWTRAERLGRHDRRVRIADSVELIAYRPERSVYGERQALAAAESHFEEASDLALRLLRARLPVARRRAVAVGMLMIALAVCEPDQARAAAELREQHLGQAAIGERGQLRAQMRRLWISVNRIPPALGGELATWTRSVRALHTGLVAGLRDGSFAPTDGRSPLGHLAVCAPPDTRPVAAAVLRCTHLMFNRLGVHGYVEAGIAGMVAGTLADFDREE